MFSSNTTQVSDGGYQISRSLRFNRADTAYLVRAPSTTTNRRTFTWSAWVKRSEITPYQSIFSANDNTFATAFGGDQQWQVFFDVGAYAVNTAQVFRDPSAWYHLVVAIDTTQATASNRVKMYVNGTQVTAFAGSPSYPPQNFDTAVNQASSNHRIGAGPTYANNWFGGYQADVYLIDGQQLTPSSFGETNVQTGVWGPKAYSGSYGTNGFYVNFSDNSNNTAATLGKDYSGNGNNFTPTNLSVTAGAGNDSLVDSPTSYGTDTGVGGTVRGNYCTLNPLSKGTNTTLSNGNLQAAGATDWTSAAGTFGITSGKWYWEYLPISGTYFICGIVTSKQNLNTYLSESVNGFGYRWDGNKQTNGAASAYGATFTGGDIIGVAFDADAGTLTFYKNGTSQGTAFSSLTSGPYFPAVSAYTSEISHSNFGQRPFAYTAPSGFKALCTQNLPTPTIGATTATQAGKFFNTVVYNGANQTAQNITTVGFQPDFTWIKWRANTYYHNLFDVIRGVNNVLSTNVAVAEGIRPGTLTSFNSDGFSLGNDSTYSGVNIDATSYVAWNWKANGSGSTNTSGTITSTVSANTTSGFSIVTLTTQASGTATVGHGLGVAPSMYIFKTRVLGESWYTYHTSLGASNFITLNGTGGSTSGPNVWNSTAPTSSVFSLGTSWVGSYTAVVYCFAPIAGYSAFGSYTGNGSTNFIYTGFRPAYVLIRRTNTAAGWGIIDSARNSINSANKYLNANASDAEGVGTAGSQYVDLLSNGFKCLDSSAGFNASGDNYIYMAFAESPFKYSLAR